MVIHTSVSDRQLVIRFLEKMLSCRSSYSGAPLFQYQIGPFTVLRDGDIETDEVSSRLLKKLESSCLIPVNNENSADGIALPIPSHSGAGYANIARIIHTRGKLINRSAGRTRSFYVSRITFRILQQYDPRCYEEFRETLAYAGGIHAVKGLQIFDDKILFTGFPYTEIPSEREAYQILAAHIVETAFTKQWTTPFSKSTDEKYLFRTWLHGIGISEKQYPTAWQILMRNYLSDKTDFYGVRTDE